MTVASRTTLTFRLHGRVGAADYAGWMAAHARKLSVDYDVVTVLPDQLTICASGPQAMVGAFALACSLGPQDVLVERVELLEWAHADGDTLSLSIF